MMSSTTTKIMAPAAKASAYGRIGAWVPATPKPTHRLKHPTQLTPEKRPMAGHALRSKWQRNRQTLRKVLNANSNGRIPSNGKITRGKGDSHSQTLGNIVDRYSQYQ